MENEIEKVKDGALAIRVQLRRERALELRLLGLSYQDISEIIRNEMKDVPDSYERRHACEDVTELLEEHGRLTSEKANELIQLELMRLDKLYLAVVPLANSGDMKAVDRAIRIMERRAKLLGLDAPQKVTVRSWKDEIIDAIKLGKITIEQVRKELGEDVARELVEQGCIASLTSGETVEGNFVEEGQVAGETHSHGGQHPDSVS